jgi:putative transposase
MPRAKRHFIPGGHYIWHITHRCHKKEFLLKFKKDKRAWLKWLYRAKKTFRIRILDYVITSNHVHLLVFDDGRPEAIARSMHLAAGQTAQQFNRRKKRCGAFWQDRYHATAVDKGSYLRRCLVYIDLNMVRAGVVRHPEHWPFGGYAELMRQKPRWGLIDEPALLEALGFSSPSRHRESRREWVEAKLLEKRLSREPAWTESVAIGRKEFVNKIKVELGARGTGKRIEEKDQEFYLREDHPSYFGPKK